jgi:hypothetical protein
MKLREAIVQQEKAKTESFKKKAIPQGLRPGSCLTLNAGAGAPTPSAIAVIASYAREPRTSRNL